MDLIPRARNFDLDALEWIYDHYNPGLYRYAYHLLGDENLAEDCVAETFSRFLKALQARKGPTGNIQGYLYRSAHNWITDHYRRRNEEYELDDEMPANDQDEVETVVEKRIRQQEMRAALTRLPQEQSQVVALHLIEGWELEEIAQTMKKSVGAVKALPHRALRNLRRHCKGQIE
jgi:RNA polymerase sigma-70 factor (ECF subfamily)